MKLVHGVAVIVEALLVGGLAVVGCGGATVIDGPSTSTTGSGGATLVGGSGGATPTMGHSGTLVVAGVDASTSVIAGDAGPAAAIDSGVPYCPVAGDTSEPELRACAIDSDCVLNDRADCCGDHYIVGLAKQAVCMLPGPNPNCMGCPQVPWYRTDDLRVEARGDGIIVRCLDNKCVSATPWCNGAVCPGDHVCVAGCVLDTSCQPLPTACGGTLNVACADALCVHDAGGLEASMVTPQDVYCQNIVCFHLR